MNNLKTLILVAFFTTLSASTSTWAGGSRVGNGGGGGKNSSITIRLDKSIELEAPYPFIQKSQFDEGIRLEGPTHIRFKKSSLGIEPLAVNQKLEIIKLPDEIQDITRQAKPDIEKYFLHEGWKPHALETECISVKFKQTGLKDVYIVTWGKNLGYVLTSDKTAAAKQASEKVIESTKVNEKCLQK